MINVREFDIAIIGGGLVGTSLAGLLAACRLRTKLRIALIEAQSFGDAAADHFESNFDARSTALSFGSAEILRELGLWTEIKKHVTPIQKVHVSDRGHFPGNVIDAGEIPVDAVGYVVENRWLSNVLITQLRTQKNVEIFAPARVALLTPQQQGSLLLVEAEGQTFSLKAALAIIADGSNSPLRQALGIQTQVRDYHQTAIITNVEFSEQHNAIAYERFTANGPLALLPLGESAGANRAALIWTLPTTEANKVFSLTDEDFLSELQNSFGFRVGRFTQVAKRHAYPLQLVYAEEQIRANLALVGNAAHLLHPVAGQGFNLALRDCACLVEVLTEAIDADIFIGKLSVLQQYVDRQARDQQLTLQFSDSLVRLFSTDNLPFIALRHLGFLSLEAFAPLKDKFTAQTVGTAGRRFQWQQKVDCGNDHPDMDDNKTDMFTSNVDQLQPVASEANTYDVIIVGAGIVGASLACALAQLESDKKLRIAVVEAGSEPKHFEDNQFDPRVVALTFASQQLLEKIRCWDDIYQTRVCAYQKMNVWDGEGTANIEFDCADVRQPQLGHIVENSVIVHALRRCMARHSNITVIQPSSVIAVTPAGPTQPLAKIGLSSATELETSLLVAADGAHSTVRQLTNFTTREWDYGQKAIITTVQTENPHEFTAWQRFMHTGPLAFLPLQQHGNAHFCSIVWSAESGLADELVTLTEAQFCARVGEAFEYRLGKVVSCSERFLIPLRQRHASTYIQPGIALVGDAAHNIHPLAGQGVNLGLLDVSALVSEVERALQRKIPIADYSILRRYQRERLAGNLGMMSAMEGFRHLFGERSLAINWLRNTGLRQLNSSSALKKLIINAALGAR